MHAFAVLTFGVYPNGLPKDQYCIDMLAAFCRKQDEDPAKEAFCTAVLARQCSFDPCEESWFKVVLKDQSCTGAQAALCRKQDVDSRKKGSGLCLDVSLLRHASALHIVHVTAVQYNMRYIYFCSLLLTV